MQAEARGFFSLITGTTLLFIGACDGSPPNDASPPPAEMPARITPLEVGGHPQAWWLFDHDTTTSLTTGEDSVIEVTVAGAALHEIRVFGPAAGEITVDDEEGWFVTVDLADLPAGWTTVPVQPPRSVEHVHVEVRPSGGTLTLAEVELWGAEAAVVPMTASEARRIYASGLSDGEQRRIDLLGAEPSFAVLDRGEEGALCATFSFALPRPSAAYRRAFVAYTAEGVFRPFELSRALNDGPAREGVDVDAGGGRAAHVEAVDLAGLSMGANSLRFCLPGEGPVVLEQVALLLEVDDGMATLEREDDWTDGRKIDEDEGATLAFSRYFAPRSALLRGAEGGGASARRWDASCRSASVDEAGADETLTVSRSTVGDGVRLDFGPSQRTGCQALSLYADADVELRSIAATGSPVGRRVEWPTVVVASPREHFGSLAWVEGWVTDRNGAPWTVELTVDGRALEVQAGVFGALLQRDVDRIWTGP